MRRLAGMYDVIIPALDKRYSQYIERTDSLMDAPSVRIMERILADQARMLRDAQDMYGKLPVLRIAKDEWATHLAARESGIESFVIHRLEQPVAPSTA